MSSQAPINIGIRRLAESDLPGVLKIAESGHGMPPWSRQTFVEMLSGEFLARRIALVATDARSDQVLGFTVASLVPPEAEVENIAVGRELQRRGIAHRLLSELTIELGNAGIAALHLEVRASNFAAIALYNSFGFKQTGRRPGYYSDPVEDAILMTLQLC